MGSTGFLVQTFSFMKWMRYTRRSFSISTFIRRNGCVIQEDVSLSPLLSISILTRRKEVSRSSLLLDDLVIEIILQLHFPLKSLMDFKYLNKIWKELLFSLLFLTFLPNNGSQVVQRYSKFKIDNLEGIECSDGMLCCLCRTNDFDYTYFHYTFIIINPVTGIYFKILVETSKGWTEMGKYHIFDTRIGNWRIIKLHPSFELKNPCLRMLVLHSSVGLKFPTYRHVNDPIEEEDSLIVFDIENECWSQISNWPPRECLCSLIVLGDSACFIDDQKLVGWTLKKEREREWEWEEIINQHDHNLESLFYLDIFIYQLEPIERHRHLFKNYSLYKPILFSDHLQ
ncbi:hypothetical protein AMTRI_Chr11g101570 [Amborella trichopoda]